MKLETLGGLTGNFADGVFFTEEPGAHYRISHDQIRVKIGRQNANLAEVKKQLARKVVRAGGNALVGFAYGQKKSFLGWDNVAWHGSGYAARIQ